MHLRGVLARFELANGRLLGITTNNPSSNYSMTPELKSTLEASRINWPEIRNHIPCIAHVIQLAPGAFMHSLGAKVHTKSSEAHERNMHIEGYEIIDIGNSKDFEKRAMLESIRCRP